MSVVFELGEGRMPRKVLTEKLQAGAGQHAVSASPTHVDGHPQAAQLLGTKKVLGPHGGQQLPKHRMPQSVCAAHAMG